jgi:hypothetical protein
VSGVEQIIEVVDVFECILSTHLLSADHSKRTQAFTSPSPAASTKSTM